MKAKKNVIFIFEDYILNTWSRAYTEICQKANYIHKNIEDIDIRIEDFNSNVYIFDIFANFGS